MNQAMHRMCAPWVAGLGVLAFVTGPVFAQTQSLPVRKPGLWEVTIRGVGDSMMRQQKVQQCTSEEAESIMLLSVVPGQEHCHDVTVKKSGKEHERHEIRTTCYVHDNRVEAAVELSGDLQATYRGVFEVTYSKPVRFNPGRTEFEGRWLGACKAGQRVGDMLLPNGATVNVVDDRKRAEAHGHDGHKH